MAHPGGIAAGVRSVRSAWETAISGVPVNSVEMAQALEKFGE
jgi:ribulose-bisphosphate carboxylase large chain